MDNDKVITEINNKVLDDFADKVWEHLKRGLYEKYYCESPPTDNVDVYYRMLQRTKPAGNGNDSN